MQKIFVLSFISFFIIAIFSCKKVPGPGGTSTITGKVIVDTLFQKNSGTVIGTNMVLGNVNVYICYGDDKIASKNSQTSYDGEFKFDYLNKGHYSVFVLGDLSWGSTRQKSVLQEIDITKNSQVVSFSNDFHINVQY
jgi:hypothetical protein